MHNSRWDHHSSAFTRGGVRAHSRWVIAAAALLAAVLASTACRARAHRHLHTGTQPATRVTEPSTPATPATHSNEAAAEPRSEDVSAGKGGISAAALDPHDVEAVLGKSIRSATGEDMGRLVDVVVDREGRPRAAIIDFGGFLGVGSRKIAVDWSALSFSHDDTKGDIITVELTRDQVKAAPEFKEGSPVVVLGAPGGQPPAPATPPQAQEK
jgi:PRC-barrel domain